MWFFVQLCSSWQDFNWLKMSRGPSAIAEPLVCLLHWIVSVSWRFSISAIVKLQLQLRLLKSFCKYYQQQIFSPFSVDCYILVKGHGPKIKGHASEATNLQRSQLVSATVHQLHYTLTSNCLFNSGSVNSRCGSYSSLHLPHAETALMLPDDGCAYLNVPAGLPTECWELSPTLLCASWSRATTCGQILDRWQPTTWHSFPQWVQPDVGLESQILDDEDDDRIWQLIFRDVKHEKFFLMAYYSQILHAINSYSLSRQRVKRLPLVRKVLI